MLRVSTLLKGISPFSLFMMDQKKNPALQGVSIAKRGQLLAKMYKQLSPSKKTDLLRRAKKHPSLTRSHKRSVDGRVTTKNNAFREFVKENYDKVRVLHHSRRFAALSKLYDLQKPIQVGNNIIRVVTPKTLGKENETSKKKSAHSAIKEVSKRNRNKSKQNKSKSKSHEKPKSKEKSKSSENEKISSEEENSPSENAAKQEQNTATSSTADKRTNSNIV